MKRFYLIVGVSIFFVLTICCMEEPKDNGKSENKRRCHLVYQKREILRLVKLHQRLGKKKVKMKVFPPEEDVHNYLCERCLRLVDELHDFQK